MIDLNHRCLLARAAFCQLVLTIFTLLEYTEASTTEHHQAITPVKDACCMTAANKSWSPPTSLPSLLHASLYKPLLYSAFYLTTTQTRLEFNSPRVQLSQQQTPNEYNEFNCLCVNYCITVEPAKVNIAACPWGSAMRSMYPHPAVITGGPSFLPIQTTPGKHNL